jgi:hypothetical protein
VVLHPETSAHAGFLRAAEAASAAMRMSLTSLGVHNANEIKRAITQFALRPNGGLIADTISLKVYNRFPPISASKLVNPVMLAPG